jgi:hypothetical protein
MLLQLVLIAAGLLLLTACEQGGDGTDASPAPPRAVGPEGGVVEVVDAASPVFGARVVIPEGALTEQRVITIEAVAPPAELPPGYMAAGVSVSFKPEGCTFTCPVAISLPYNDHDNNGIIDGSSIPESRAGIFYFNEDTRGWEQVAIIGRDAGSNIITGTTAHFSTYLVPVDQTGNGTGGGDSAPDLIPGEYFVGEPSYRIAPDGSRELVPLGCLGQDQQACSASDTCRDCGTPYVLTVRSEITDNGTVLGTVIDRFATRSGGYPAVINAEGTCASFDIADPSGYFPFAKLRSSGDAEAWEWRSEYVTSWTELNGYTACSDDTHTAICDNTSGRKVSTITASGTVVTICFGIDLSDDVNRQGLPMPNVFIGNYGLLPITFEAWYKG